MSRSNADILGRSDLKSPYPIEPTPGITVPVAGALVPPPSPGPRLLELITEIEQLREQNQLHERTIQSSGYDYRGREGWERIMEVMGRR